MAVWTPVIVVLRSATICEIDTFITLLSRTITNWAAARIAIGSQLVRMGGHRTRSSPAGSAGCEPGRPVRRARTGYRPGRRDPMTQTTVTATPAAAEETGRAPEQAGLVLLSLILVAAVANLNLSVANVALPDIGKAFDASQTALDLVAVG